MLRTIRLAANLGMKIENGTRAQIRAAAPDLKQVSPERLRDELFRLLEAPRLTTSLRALDLLGALQPILPEFEQLKGLNQSPPHAFDVWEHTLRVIEKLALVIGLLGEDYSSDGAGDLHSGLVVLRLGRYRHQISELLATELVPGRSRKALLFLAAIYHDMGKPPARYVEVDGRIRFTGHEQNSAELVSGRALALHLGNAERDYLDAVVRSHGRPFALTQTRELPTRRAIYRYFRDAGDKGVDVCLLSLADFMGKYGADMPQEALAEHLETLRTLLEAYFEKPDEIVSPPTLLKGDELMKELKMKPGPKVGELLEAVREAQAAGDVGSRDEALNLARNLKRGAAIE